MINEPSVSESLSESVSESLTDKRATLSASRLYRNRNLNAEKRLIEGESTERLELELEVTNGRVRNQVKQPDAQSSLRQRNAAAVARAGSYGRRA